MQTTFIDLDELILLCRDESAKRLIQEAVACYRAGAYRSCIVSTWNAIVFDFIHKLRELQLMGNGEAIKLLEGFEKKREGPDFRGLWKFESDIPKDARKKFELLSYIEERDIERLLEDRNRCAHPSVISLDEPFEATAELARYHMRSAVTHLLQRPPVQGRQALERVRKDINSEYFPDDLRSAIKNLEAGPLARPRPSLVNDIVYELSNKLLQENLLEKKTVQLYTAIRAIVEMHREYIKKFLNTGLPKILSQTNDDQWYKVVRYLREVAIAQNLDEPYRSKTCVFIQNIEITYFTRLDQEWKQVFIDASYIDFLEHIIVDKLKNMPLIQRLRIEAESLSPNVRPIMESFESSQIEGFVDNFVEASSYNVANLHADVWPKLSANMDLSHQEMILNAYFENNQILGSRNFPKAVQKILEKQKKLDQPMPSYWDNFRKKLDDSNFHMQDLKVAIDSYYNDNGS